MSYDLLLIIEPDGGEREELLFNPFKLLNVEAMAIERASGMNVTDVMYGLANGPSMVAATAAVWIVRKRANPRLNFEDVIFTFEDFRTEDPDNLADAKAAEAENVAEAAGVPKDPADSQEPPNSDQSPEQISAPSTGA